MSLTMLQVDHVVLLFNDAIKARDLTSFTDDEVWSLYQAFIIAERAAVFMGDESAATRARLKTSEFREFLKARGYKLRGEY